MSYLWSPSYGDSYRQNWPLFADPRRAVMHEAVAKLPRSAPTAASYQLVPHLAHRERIYTFPNPWIVTYWGVDVRTAAGGTVVRPHPDDPAVVQWIAVDQTVLSPSAVALLDQLKRSGAWIVHLDREGVVVLERR
jgi:hypothetical protein